MEDALKVFEKKTLSEFVGLKECLTFITLKNSSESSHAGSHEKGSVPIFKKSGKLNITSQRYMNLIEAFKPDFFTILADGDTNENSSKKRVTKSVERSQEFFEECLLVRNSSKSLQEIFMIANVEGGYNELDRKKAVEYLKEHEAVIDGYFIDGLHQNGPEATSLQISSLCQMVGYTVDLLPKEKMKLMLGAYLPHNTLELIRLGIDVFDTAFPSIVTACNRALTFNFNFDNCVQNRPEIDLRDELFKDDFTPIVEDCKCYTCAKHSKAYINHLLCTNELLGPALLSIHNLYFYHRFFDAIRDSINCDRLPHLIELITKQYVNFQGKLNYDPTPNLDQIKTKRQSV